MSPAPTAFDFDRVFGHPYLDVVLPRFEEYLRDVDGRPLGEANAPEPARADVAFVFRRCPYPNSRRDGLMNISALAPLAATWDEVLALMLTLRGAFMARYPVPMNYLLLARMAGFLTHYSGWLVRSGQVPWNAVPRAVSGLFKAAQGLFFTANDAMLDGGPATAFGPVTVDSFLDRTEARQIFRVGQRVCAGPPEMVRRFVDAAIEGGRASVAMPLDAALGEAIRYAELRLHAQQAQRAHSLALSLGLERAEGRPTADQGVALAELERQAGLKKAALPAEVEAGLPGVLRPGDSGPRAVAIAFARTCAELWLRHAGLAMELQARINPTLGRTSGDDFDHESRLALLRALDDRNLCARADAILDLAGLARLMDAAKAAGPATSLRR